MNYELDMRMFWETNEICWDLKENIPRVPLKLGLDDWICGCFTPDLVKYYTDFDYQQEHRLRCSELTKKELHFEIYPDVDLGVVMDASVYGGEVNYEAKATPTLRPVINDPEEVDGLIDKIYKADILEQGLVPKYLEWREKVRARYGITLTYGGGTKGCATMLGQLCGITNFLTWIVTAPEQIKKLIGCWADTSKRYIAAMRKVTGYPEAHAGFYFASDVTGMLSPSLYREFIMKYEKELYELYAPDPSDKRFYHADSHMLHQLDALREIGVNEVNIDPYIEPAAILEKIPGAIVYGQIPPTAVLLYGTPEDVVNCVRRDIEQAGPGKHLVLTTAGDVNPETSFENLKAMCYAVEKYGYIYG